MSSRSVPLPAIYLSEHSRLLSVKHGLIAPPNSIASPLLDVSIRSAGNSVSTLKLEGSAFNSPAILWLRFVLPLPFCL